MAYENSSMAIAVLLFRQECLGLRHTPGDRGRIKSRLSGHHELGAHRKRGMRPRKPSVQSVNSDSAVQRRHRRALGFPHDEAHHVLTQLHIELRAQRYVRVALR
jgi:hypothetical protein